MADETPKEENAPETSSTPEGGAETSGPTAENREPVREDSRVVDDRSRPGGAETGRGRGQGRGERRPRRGRRREERDEYQDEFSDTLVPDGIFRCSATVKGGRRLSFGALVVVGDRNGRVGAGYGKAKEVPQAIQKAIKIGRKSVERFPLVGDGTIPHEVRGRYGAAEVVLVPAGPGTGIIAGATVKTVLEMGGVHNVLTKSFGSNNRKNLVKATMDALQRLRSREDVQRLRGVEVAT